MITDEEKEKRVIDKFKRLYAHKQGGIFRQKTRERIITKKGLSGRDKNTFWYRQRMNIETTLVDLQLFIEQAGKSNVNQVVTAETLEPVVHALLGLPVTYEKLPDRKRAEIARLFIERGFEYLSAKSGNYVSLHKRIIKEALELSALLVRTFKEE